MPRKSAAPKKAFARWRRFSRLVETMALGVVLIGWSDDHSTSRGALIRQVSNWLPSRKLEDHVGQSLLRLINLAGETRYSAAQQKLRKSAAYLPRLARFRCAPSSSNGGAWHSQNRGCRRV